jgi:dolichol-phosphate mannosyltransferase
VLPRLYCLIPVFNEADNVSNLLVSFRDLLEKLADYSLEFVILDDGSQDASADGFASADDLPITILKHPTNLGPGAAFATGFSYLANRLRDEDWVVTMEGDNTSCHELVVQMLQRTQEGYDVVLASPYLYGGAIVNTEFYRTFLSYGANIFIKELIELRGILTMSSFFRLYRGTAILRLQTVYGAGIIERRGFECMIELLMKIVNLKMPLSEVAMVLDTSKRKGKSKMNVVRTIFNVLALLFLKKKWKMLAVLGTPA